MNNKFLQEIKKLVPKSKLGTDKNLPIMFFFTDRKRIGDVCAVVETLPKNTAIIIREYDLSFDDRYIFAQKISALAKQKGLKILVGKDWELAKKLAADGVHFSDLDQDFMIPKNHQNMILSYSCHHSSSIQKAEKLNADLVFYSPIFASKSHLDEKPAGVDKLRQFVAKSSLPTYALGGINEENIRLLTNTGIAGIGGISMFVDSL